MISFVTWFFILVVLCSFDEEILHIIGSLMPAHTGNIHWLDRNLEEISEFDRSFNKLKVFEWQTFYMLTCKGFNVNVVA